MRSGVLCLALIVTSVSIAQAQVAEVATFVGCEILKGIGSQLVEVGLDQLWGKDVSSEQRVTELQGRLAAYESGLRQVASSSHSRATELASRQTAYESGLREVAGKLADQVASLRKDVSTRTTADDVRTIVKQTLKELEDRSGHLEYRQDQVESRVRQIEELFGYIPTVTPAPLLVTGSSGLEKPTAHPLLVEWLPLLVRSEQSRNRLIELGRTLQPTSQRFKAELAKDREIIEESKKLHEKVIRELAAKLPERQAVLQEYRPGTKEVRQVDESLATLTWLAAVTRPVASGPDAGRLGVPGQLFGFDAPEVVRAFEISEVDQRQVIELYRRHFLTVESMQPTLAISIHRGRLSPAMLEAADRIRKLALEGFDLTRKMPDIEQRLDKARSDYADSTPQVSAIRDEQLAFLKAARNLQVNLNTALGRGVEVYLLAQKTERPTNPRMTAFRQGVLIPAVAWLNWLAPVERSEIDITSWQPLLARRWKGVVTLQGRAGHLACVAFSPDGSRIASGHGDGSVKVWDAVSGRELFNLNGHTFWGRSLAFSPDGRLIAGSSKWDVIIWDAVLGKEIATAQGYTDSMCSAISPDGSRLVSGSLDGLIRIWDTKNWTEIARLTGHKNFILDVAFSPDGSRIASGSHDNTIKVWDTRTAKEIATFSVHTNTVISVAFSPDGSTIASSSGDRKSHHDTSGDEIFLCLGRGLQTGWLEYRERRRQIGQIVEF